MQPTDELYPFQVFQNWGDDADAETMAEVWLFLLTSLGSIPYFREYGTLFPQVIGQPAEDTIMLLAKISAVQSLAQAATVSAASRQAITDYSFIQTKLDSGHQGDGDVDLTYVRLANQQKVNITL